ncbi:MAG: DUF5615 family PIN-like protein [Saprospiraceae bacterium]|nr:DUF5615 family PIN-like protein [Saprospiraceae bacterium]
MAKYLIDANLPYYFGLWNNSDFKHVKDLNDTWSDDEIWNYAKNNNLIIITKDTDFSNKVMLKGAPPKVIHLRIGNLKIKDFHRLLSNDWEFIIDVIKDSSLVNVYIDRIESIK